MASKNAEKIAKDTFEGKGFSLDLPEISLSEKEIKQGISLLDFLSENKIMSSKSEAEEQFLMAVLKLMII